MRHTCTQLSPATCSWLANNSKGSSTKSSRGPSRLCIACRGSPSPQLGRSNGRIGILLPAFSIHCYRPLQLRMEVHRDYSVAASVAIASCTWTGGGPWACDVASCWGGIGILTRGEFGPFNVCAGMAIWTGGYVVYVARDLLMLVWVVTIIYSGSAIYWQQLIFTSG